MAVNCPNPVDVTTFQFKLQDKIRLCEIKNELKSNINLLASASAYGLIFLGNPLKAEIKVIQNQKLIASKEEDFKIPVRTVPIENVANNITLSSDDALLAVNYNVQTSTLVEIFDVKSFLSKNIVSKFKIPVATDANAEVVQIVWNPVLCSIFSVVLNNGTLSCFNLKENSLELNTATNQEPAKCACWSPKGKQLVVGFPNGKLVQYKQDLSVARTINCPGNILGGAFDTIAVQWLSVYQFAAVFLEHGEDACPNLFIINAPKTGNPTYISYGDICYSSSGPRQGQVFFKHIQPWNVLLVASANSMEVGMLGTSESGEAPNWIQYIPPDEARIELPLNTNKQETHPIGFSLDTSSTHHVMIGETKIPVMPMIHLWSTDGHLVSFNFLNLSQGAPDICSPPQPIADVSGSAEFLPYDTSTGGSIQPAPAPAPAPAPIAKSSSSVNLGLQMNTPPAAESKPSLFGGNAFQAKPGFAFPSTPGSLFGGLAQPNATKPSSVQFGSITGKTTEAKPTSTSTPPSAFSFPQQSGISFGTPVEEKSKGILGDKAFGQENQQLIIKPTAQKFDESNVPVKPLYMATQVPQPQPIQQQAKEAPKTVDKDYMNMYEIDDILAEMIRTEMQAFQIEINNHVAKSRNITNMIKSMDDSKTFVKQLNGLQDLSKQATESTESLAMDIHALRQTLTESFAMLAEIRSKLKMFQEPRISRLEIVMPNLNQANQRQITKFQNALATNEVQLQIVAQQIEGLWVNHQDQNEARKRLRIPSLEIVYQTLATYKDILSREREKIKRIKAKFASFSAQGTPIDSLNDSILSLSLQEKVESESSLLESEKLKNLRQMLGTLKIMKTKPHRPTRTSLNTEVILEDKIKKAKAPKPKLQQKSAPLESKVKETPKKIESVQKQQAPVSVPRPLSQTTKMGFGFGDMGSIRVEPPKQPPQSVPQVKATTTPKPKGTALFTGQTSFASLHAGDQKKPELQPFSMPPTSVFQMPSTPEVKTTTDAPLFLKNTTTLTSNNPSKTGSFDLSFQSFGFNTQPSEKPASKVPTLFGENLPNLELRKTEPAPMPAVTSTQSPAVSLSGESTVFKMSEANADSILDSLKICKPTATTKPTPATSSLTSSSTESKPLFGGTGTKSFFDVPTTTASKLVFPQSTGTLFGAPATTSAPAFAPVSTAAVTTALATTVAPVTATATATATAPVTSQQTTFGIPSMSTFGITSLATTSTPSTAVNLSKPTISFFTTSSTSTTTSTPSTPEVSLTQTSTPSSTPSTLTFSFVTGSTAPETSTIFGKPATASTPQLSFTGFSFPASTSITQTSASTPFKPAFAPATTTAASNLFKEMPKPDQSVFDAVAASTAISTPATTATATTAATTPFGVPPVSQTPAIGGSVFGTPTTSTGGTVFGTPATSASTGLFGTPTTTSAGASVFGTPAATQASVFSTPASAAATPFGSATSTFGIQTSTTGTSLFGGSTISQPSNVFGGGGLGTATSTATPFGTPFGTPPTTSQTTGGSFFSSSSFGTPAPAGGSVFGGSTAATTQASGFGTNIFGGGTNQTPTGQPSIFGGSSQPAFGGTAFGGSQQPFGSTAAPAFGQAQAFGQTSPGGTFLQGGPSIAQTGFGSPGSSGFAKPAFGAAPSFGGPPTFGSSPTFGGGATFGAPKNTFGGFGTGGGSPTAFSPPSQKNNLFETLGSSDTGPSFGNLAQSAFNNDSAKQQFGGSSFSSWR